MLALLLACAPTPTSTAMAAVDSLSWVDTAERAAPLSLTAADGTGLELRELHVEAVVDGPLAFTELHLVFHNPEARTIEGRFVITLPSGAAVSRFAMKLDDAWPEGEVVEDELHEMYDPLHQLVPCKAIVMDKML